MVDPGDQGERARLMEIHDCAAQFFAAHLADAWAEAYLADRFRAGAELTAWNPGYAPDAWTALTEHLKAHPGRFTDTELEASGLVARSPRTGRLYDVFRDRIMFPITDPDGRAIAFVGRQHPDADRVPDTRKYINSPSTAIYSKGEHLFGLGQAREALAAGARPVIVEGVFDPIAITIRCEGDAVGLAPLGTALTAAQIDALKQAVPGVREVVNAFDADPAGRRAARRAYLLQLEHGLRPTTVRLPDGEDPASYLGPGHRPQVAAFRRGLEARIPLVHELLEHVLRETQDAASPGTSPQDAGFQAVEASIPLIKPLLGDLDQARDAIAHLEQISGLTPGSGGRLAAWHLGLDVEETFAAERAAPLRTSPERPAASPASKEEHVPDPQTPVALAGAEASGGADQPALPHDATPVDEVEGYHYTRIDGRTTVYGPDNHPVGSAEYPGDGMVEGTRIPSRWGNFAVLAARQHHAAHLPAEQQDRVQVRIVPDTGAKAGYVVEVHGTHREDPRDERAVKDVGHFLWSGRKEARVSGRAWTERTVQENFARVLTEFARQGRQVVVRDDGQGPTTTAPAAGSRAPAPAPPVPAPAAPVAPDPGAMTDEELLGAIDAAGGRSSLDALKAEQQARVRRRLDEAPEVAGMADADLAAEYSWLTGRFAAYAFGLGDEGGRAVTARRNALRAEQQVREARALLAGPVPGEMDDQALDAALTRAGRLFLPPSHELRDAADRYQDGLRDEIAARRVSHYQQRPDIQGMTLEELIAESSELARLKEALWLERRADVPQSRGQRLEAVDAEIERREAARFPNELARVKVTRRGTDREVTIDGMPDRYGTVEVAGDGQAWIRVGYGGKREGPFESHPAAVAALVHRYDQDPQTVPQRAWGVPVRVMIPVSAHEEVWDWLRHRTDGQDGSPELRRLAEILQEIPTRQRHRNPLTGQTMQVFPYSIEEGLLDELARVGERVTTRLRERSADPELARADREAAKRRIPAMGAALHGINTVRDQAVAAGRDTDRRAVDDNQVAAQVAALAAGIAAGTDEGDSRDDQQVHADGQAALAAAPSSGAGSHAGPGGVPAGHGAAVAPGGGRGAGGAGGDPGPRDGLPGQGGPAEPDPGHRGAAGDGAVASSPRGRGRAADPAASAGLSRPGHPEAAARARFRPDPAGTVRGALARAQANLAAIQVLRRLEQQGLAATDADKRVLSSWSGWGSVPVVFLEEPDAKNPVYAAGGERAGRYEADLARWEEYSPVRTQLRDLLDPFEWNAAARATLSAHYTPWTLAEAMWDGLQAFGFDGGEVLEAGCGSGIFFGAAPDLEHLRLTGVELDGVTARICQLIYPHANVLAESFADTDAPAASFDAAIGNVPFAQVPFTERRYGATGHSLHNGFLIKQAALVREGGLVVAVTSRWTLDGEEAASARRRMGHYADLLGAFRLPAGVFAETAGTDVVVDVLVLRRRGEGEPAADPVWLDAPKQQINGSIHTINAYFGEHPQHVLGQLTTEAGPYGPRPTVKGDPAAALEQLRTRLRQLAEQATAAGQGYLPHPAGPDRPALNLRTARDKHASDYTGRLYRDEDGRIWQHINGADPAPVVCSDGNTSQLLALMQLRDVAAELKDLDRAGDEPARAERLRARLRDLHASYTAAHGPLSRPRQPRMAAGEQARDQARAEGRAVRETERTPTAWGWFREDPDAATVLALESWDRARQAPVLSEVLTRRPGTRGRDLQHTDDPKAALTAVMGATGRVDLDRIADLLGTDPATARRRLGTDVFDNPVTGHLEHAGSYLSGAVRLKLEQARQAAATDPTYAVNVAALELVQPPEKRIGQFTPQLGAHWIPAAIVQGFLREYLGDPTLHVNHNDRYGWTVEAGKVPDAVNALKGTQRRTALQIARAVLGRGSLIVEDSTVTTTGAVVHEVNEDASRAARQKADAMRSAFEEYVTADSGRVKALTDAYNRIMNGHVVRNYDGLSPSMAGFTTDRTPHPWQTAGAARMQFERSVILAHDVGLGKTTTMIMGAAALKASGQVTKPFAIMQRHLARSWLKEAQFLYPAADIRLITSEMLAGDERRRTLEWLRSNTPDLTLFTEGAFTSVKMSPEYQEWYEFRELGNLREQVLRERGVPDNALAAMRLEQRLATLEARLRRNAAPMRTPGALYWEDLGFDYAMIDEAHRFLGVGFRSRDAGGDTAKIRAVDLHQKLTQMHRVSADRGGVPTVTLASGTPLKNSIFDQYKMLALAAPWVLEAFGVAGPDLWAQTFGQTVQRVEMAPDGSGLKVVERFSRFISKKAMKTMWGLVADTKTADDVGIPRPRVAGGGAQLHLIDPTADQTARLGRLVARGAAIHAGEVTRDQDNMLAVANDGRAIACDPRLIDPGAPPGPKLAAVADWFAARYHATKDRVYAVSHTNPTPHSVPGGLLIGFLNQGTPGGSNKGGFDAYAELRDLCAARGIPPEKIAFAQDHNRNLESLEELYRRCSEGEVSLVLASTEVMGTGANIQNRAVALAHIDLDWNPAGIAQREGRLVRFGNQNPEVEIAVFALRGSMDSWQAGLLAAKAEGLRDIQRPDPGDDAGDSVEEIGDLDWDYATMQAEISGNPYMGRLIQARLHLAGLESDRRNHAADRLRQSELLAAKQQEAELTRQAIARREEVLPLITPVRGDDFTIAIGQTTHHARRQAAASLREAVAGLLMQHRSAGLSPWHLLGQFGGLPFGARTELTETGQLQALTGFPDLRHSEAAYTVSDLTKETAGAAMLRHLAAALEQAGDHQRLDRQRLPGLETEITQLAQQQAAEDYTDRITHARRRVELLDDLVAAIAERDKIAEPREEDLDPATYPTPQARKQELDRRAAQRRPLQAKVDEAITRLSAFDRDQPPPRAGSALPASEASTQARPDPVAADPLHPQSDPRPPGDAVAPSAASPDAQQEPAPPASPETPPAAAGGRPATEHEEAAELELPQTEQLLEQPAAAASGEESDTMDGESHDPWARFSEREQAGLRVAVEDHAAAYLTDGPLNPAGSRYILEVTPLRGLVDAHGADAVAAAVSAYVAAHPEVMERRYGDDELLARAADRAEQARPLVDEFIRAYRARDYPRALDLLHDAELIAPGARNYTRIRTRIQRQMEAAAGSAPPTPTPADDSPGYGILNQLLADRRAMSDIDHHFYDELAVRIRDWTSSGRSNGATEQWLTENQRPELVTAFLDRLAVTRRGAVNDTWDVLRQMETEIADAAADTRAWDPRTTPARIPDTDEPLVPAFTPAQQVMIEHAVEDWAANYYGGPFQLGRDSAVRYVSEGHLRELVAAYGYNAVHNGVQQYLDSHPEVLNRRTTDKERAARSEARRARAQEILRQANEAARGQDFVRALDLIDQAELENPLGRDYDAIRTRIRTLASTTSPQPHAETQPHVETQRQDTPPQPPQAAGGEQAAATSEPVPADHGHETSLSVTTHSDTIDGSAVATQPPIPLEGTPVATPSPETDPGAPAAPLGIVIEHTREGSLVFGTVRGDRLVRAALRAPRTWRWSSNIGTDGAWYLPRRMDFETRSQEVLQLEERLRALGRPLARHGSDTWRTGPSQTTDVGEQAADEQAAASPSLQDTTRPTPTADPVDADRAAFWQDRDAAEGRAHDQARAQTARKQRAGAPLTEAEREDEAVMAAYDAMFSATDDGDDPADAAADDTLFAVESPAPAAEQLGFDLSPEPGLPEARPLPADEDAMDELGGTGRQVAPATQEIVLEVDSQALNLVGAASADTVAAPLQAGPPPADELGGTGRQAAPATQEIILEDDSQALNLAGAASADTAAALPQADPPPADELGGTGRQTAPDTQEIVLEDDSQALDLVGAASVDTVAAPLQAGPPEAFAGAVPGGAEGCWARPWTAEEIRAARERMAAETPAPSTAPMTPTQIATARERMAAETPAPSTAPMTPNELHEQLLLRMGLAADDVQRLRAGLASARDDIDRVLYSRPCAPGRTSSAVRAYETGMDYLGAAFQAVAAGVREAVTIGIQEIAGPEWERINRVWQQMRQTWSTARDGGRRGGPSALQPWGTQLRAAAGQAARAIAGLAGQWAARLDGTGQDGSWAHRAAQTLATVATHVADHLQPEAPASASAPSRGMDERVAAAIRLAAGSGQPRTGSGAPATASGPTEIWDAAIARLSGLQVRMEAQFEGLDHRLATATVTSGWVPPAADAQPVLTSSVVPYQEEETSRAR